MRLFAQNADRQDEKVVQSSVQEFSLPFCFSKDPRNVRNREAVGPKRCSHPSRPPWPLLLESVHKLYFDWTPDVTAIERVGQKPADSRASDLAIIGSKFVHVDAADFAG